MADLRNRGVRDILIACCDGLAGFEDAIHSAFPAATVQTCVVHYPETAVMPGTHAYCRCSSESLVAVPA
jgi:transposase-like protein